MRMETLWQSQRRAARRRWWQEMVEGVDRPGVTWNELLDETVRLRFHVTPANGVSREPDGRDVVGARS